jgi:Zincin-like metallopeptidase
VQDGDAEQPGTRIRRRDRHGRGLRGSLAPPGVPLHRTRAERFDDLVLQAVARLEPRWEAQLAGVEFAVEEIPPPAALAGPVRGPVPLSRLEPGMPRPAGGPAGEGAARDDLLFAGEAGKDLSRPIPAPPARARIVVYRRPLIARAEGEDDLSDLVFDVVVEEFARLVGLDPAEVDPGYSGED